MSRSKPINIHAPKLRTTVRTLQDARRFIDRVGFALLFPKRSIKLPSLSEAMGIGPCPFPDWPKGMDELWDYKDLLPERGYAYYGAFFRGGAPGFISRKLLPYVYALFHKGGSPEDFRKAHRDGRISGDAYQICESIYKGGKVPTIVLRRALGWGGEKGGARFKKALVELQRLLLVAKVGTYEGMTAWAAEVVDLLSRAFPEVPKIAKSISQTAALMRLNSKSSAKPSSLQSLLS